MIHERRTNVHFTQRELHLAQFVDVHLRGEFTHRDGKEWRPHRLRHYSAEGGPGAGKTQNANFVFRIVCGLKEWESLDVVPVGMSNQQRELYRSRLKFSVESDSERPNA